MEIMEDNNEDVVEMAKIDVLVETLPPKLGVTPPEEPDAGEGDALDSHHDQTVSFRECCEGPALDATENKENAIQLDVILGHETVSGDDAGGECGDSDDEYEQDDDEEEDDEEAEVLDIDARTESANGSVDNEVERHEINATLLGTDMSLAVMTEASKTVLFRRYSKMTPSAMEEQERSFHEDAFQESATMNHHAFCPEPTVQTCQNPACADQLRWRDARIAELQAALDHMTEAMAIQQRDMASQRVFLSRQAEQLTNLSNKLHQDKVALHLERERFQRTVASTPPIVSIANKLKPAAGKIKSPVKKLFSAASGRRASFTAGVESMSSGSMKFHSSSASTLEPVSRTNSSAQLRRNPLVSDCPEISTPIKDRSSSLSVLDLRLSSEQGVIAITPPKSNSTRMVDVKLNDGFSPVKSSNPRVETPTSSPPMTDMDSFKRMDRVESSADPSGEQKKQSLGDRLRSIRWGRS